MSLSPRPGNGTTDDDRGGEPTQPRRRSLAQSIACSSEQTVLCRVTGRGRADTASLRRQGGPHGVVALQALVVPSRRVVSGVTAGTLGARRTP